MTSVMRLFTRGLPDAENIGRVTTSRSSTRDTVADDLVRDVEAFLVMVEGSLGLPAPQLLLASG